MHTSSGLRSYQIVHVVQQDQSQVRPLTLVLTQGYRFSVSPFAPAGTLTGMNTSELADLRQHNSPSPEGSVDRLARRTGRSRWIGLRYHTRHRYILKAHRNSTQPSSYRLPTEEAKEHDAAKSLPLVAPASAALRLGHPARRQGELPSVVRAPTSDADASSAHLARASCLAASKASVREGRGDLPSLSITFSLSPFFSLSPYY